MTTLIMFFIMEGLYIIRQDEGAGRGKKKRRRKRIEYEYETEEEDFEDDDLAGTEEEEAPEAEEE